MTKEVREGGDSGVLAPREETQVSPKDVCHCGDYRHQHDERGCKVCRSGQAPWDRCNGFRLHERAKP